jgi:hypothetical protein
MSLSGSTAQAVAARKKNRKQVRDKETCNRRALRAKWTQCFSRQLAIEFAPVSVGEKRDEPIGE